MAMKPIAPKPFSTPKTKPTYKFKKAMPSPNRGKDPIQKGLEFLFGDNPKGKPSAPKPRGKVPGKPVPLATPRPRTYPRGAKPAPMPEYPRGVKPTPKPAPMPKRTPAGPNGKREMPYTGPRRERNPNLKPAGPKKKTPSTATPKPKAKKPTLNDFLSKGKRPPIKPGFKLPSDADIILKGYNDKKTLNKYKKK